MGRIRAKYIKDKEVRFISHLDIVRALERAFRRADIPFVLTEGFNPKPKINFSPPLSLGYISKAEYFDLDVGDDMIPEEFIYRMNNVLPQGIMVIKAISIDEKSKSLNSIIKSSEYNVYYPFPEGVLSGIERFLSDEIMVEKESKKGKKTINIRPLIYSFSKVDEKNICLWLASNSSESVNPVYVVKAFLHFSGFDFEESNAIITRLEQYIDEKKNTPMREGVINEPINN